MSKKNKINIESKDKSSSQDLLNSNENEVEIDDIPKNSNICDDNCDKSDSINLNETTNPKKQNKKFKKIFVVGSIIILVVSSTSFICLNTSKMQHLSYNGLYVDSEHVGKLTKEELTSKLSSLLAEKLTNSIITITNGQKEILTTPNELGVTYNIDKIVHDILSCNKSGNIILDTLTRLSLEINNQNIEYTPVINETVIDSFVETICKEFNVKPKNAGIKFNDSSIEATPESKGLEVDTIKLKDDLLQLINSNFNGTSEISLQFKEINPVLTKATAEKLEILGTHKTKLPSKTGDRTGNIKLYTSKLNNTVLAPGEEFSCDTGGGNREWSDGYRNAPGYVNGEVVPILAGGICQATSTIYNALLYADLEITERSPHSMPVTYAEIGLDAAIAKGVKDLKFKNNTNNPIILQTYVNNDGYVVATIWGIPDVENKKIELVTKKHNSKSADAYKKTYINGELVKTELLSKDRYK